MDPISDVDLKPSNFCQCCLKGGCYKNISAEYYYAGEREKYEAMLYNTFDIQFPQNDMEPVDYLICDECITRLREANTFKNMVVHNQGKLKDMEKNKYSEKDITMDEEIKLADIKTETPETEPIDDIFDDDDILANVKMETDIPSDAILDSEPEEKPEKEYKSKKKTKLKKFKTNSEPNNEKAQKNLSKILERRGNGPILRENSLKLIANSTIFVFQWDKSRYRCFCCKEPFSDVNALREHTNTKHNLKAIEKKIIDQQNRLVKVEVSIISCKLCSQSFDNLTILRTHLIDEHGLKFELDDDLLVPFKIGGELFCQLCEEKFTVFRLLNIHMNKHFSKQVCHICGTGFSNLVFLNLHKIRYHRPLKCRQCDLTFNSKADKKSHEVSIHGIKFERKLRFPCPHCPERFFQENYRVQHLVDKHDLKKPEFKCDICCKVFITKSLANNHLRNVHLKEKCHECDICHHLFYTKSDVSRHKITHTGEKRFSCAMCNNPFASKDSLKRHMKRTHGVQ